MIGSKVAAKKLENLILDVQWGIKCRAQKIAPGEYTFNNPFSIAPDGHGDEVVKFKISGGNIQIVTEYEYDSIERNIDEFDVSTLVVVLSQIQNKEYYLSNNDNEE